jgi:hypothetical protein
VEGFVEDGGGLGVLGNEAFLRVAHGDIGSVEGTHLLRHLGSGRLVASEGATLPILSLRQLGLHPHRPLPTGILPNRTILSH